MKLDESSIKPLYLQIAELIEQEILQGHLLEGGACYSQILLAKELSVNPATAGKGLQHLVSEGILEKKRGQAMIIANGAKERIKERLKKEELGQLISQLIEISLQLGLSENEIVALIHEKYT